MVVESIEVKYAQLKDTVREPGGRTLGTYFLEKIIQLEFRIPLSEEARMRNYVDQLLEFERKQHKHTSEVPYEVKQAAEAIQAERRVGVDDMDQALRTAQKRWPDFPKEVWEKAKIQVKIRFVESPEVRQAIYRVIPYLNGNPRQIKRFINAFRLQTMLSKRLGFIKDTPEDLDIQAKAIIVWMRWPVLARESVANIHVFPQFYRICHYYFDNPEEPDAKYEQLLKTLPTSIRPLLQVDDIVKFIQSIDEKEIPRFLRLLGAAQVIASSEIDSSQ